MGLSGVHRGRMSRRVVPLVLVSFLMRMSWQTPFVVGASTPLVIAPSEFTAGAFVAVRVHGAVGASGLTVVLADLTSTTSPVTVATASVPSSGGDAVTVTVAVPSSVDTTKSNYKLRLFASSASISSTPIAEHDVSIVIAQGSSASSTITTLILESDKPAYKPGQDINARALAIESETLNPVAGTVTFTFRDPQGFVARRITATADTYGVAEATMATSTEPTLGQWSVEASFVASTGSDAINANTLPFTLEKYVLPTFDVQIDLTSDSVFRGLGRVEGSVKATYTHGASVAGEVEISVWQKSSYQSNGMDVFGGGMMGMAMDAGRMIMEDSVSSNTNTGDAYTLLKKLPSMRLETGTSGTSFSVDLSDTSIDYGWGGYWSSSEQLVVEASVKSAATGETQNGTAPAYPRYRAYDVEIIGPGSFKPGLPAECVFKAKTFSGESLAGTFSVTVKWYKKNGSYLTGSAIAVTLSDADDGTKYFYVDVPLDDTSCCQVRDATQWRSGSCCLSSGELSFDSDLSGAKNTAVSLNSAAASVSDAVPTATYWSGFATPPGVLNAYLTIHGAPLDKVEVGAEVTLTVRSSFTPPGNYFDWSLVQNGKGVLASGEVTKDGTLTFTATASMTSAQLIVYVGNDGAGGESDNVVVCVKSIAVNLASRENLPQDVSLSLSTSETTPGGSVVLTTTATAPGSRVYLLAHDTSVLLQSNGKQSAMSASKVLQAVAEINGDDIDISFDPASSMFGSSSCYPPADIDASEITVLTAMKTLACLPNQGGMFGGMYEDDMAMMDGVPEMAFAAMDERMESADADTGASSDSSSDTGKIQTRRFFPETWLWRAVDTDATSGIATLNDLTAPDTITSWRFRAFSTHPSLGIGVASETADSSLLTVSKPFFVRPFLPYSAVWGEEIAVRVGVFNDLAVAVTANVELVADDASFERVSSSTSNSVTVAAKSSGSTQFAIRPKVLGTISITVTGTTGASSGSLSDAVVKTLTVVPEGFPQVTTVNAMVRRERSAASDQLTLTADLPISDQIVTGSIFSQLTLIGDIMGPSLSGLDMLIQMPFGCGEQNMITLAPNVAAVKYLVAAGKVTDGVSTKASRNVNTGYQRQLTYRHTSGAFSAFGETEYDGSANPGSLWLTAFVLRVFANADSISQLDFVADPTVLSTAAAFIASSQNPDGSFTDPSPPIHTEMTGGAGAGTGLAAYCLLAMVDAGRRANNVQKTITYLEGRINGGDRNLNSNGYVVAIAARALTRACTVVELGCTAAVTAREKLRSMGTLNGDGTKHWGGVGDAWSSADGFTQFPITIGYETSAEVEATGYVCLTFVEAGDLENAYPAARWLMLRRNANGGFRSTQDTVVGLEALSAFAAATLDTDFSLDVSVSPSGSSTFSKAITSSNFDVLQREEIGDASSVQISITGSGTALAQLSVSYNLVADPSPPSYDLSVTAKAVVEDTRRRFFSRRKLNQADNKLAEDFETIEITGCTNRIDGSNSGLGMVLLTVGVYTGFAPTTESLDSIRLIGAGVVRRVDVEDRSVVFYLEDVTHEETCVSFDVTKRFETANLQPGISSVSAYYHPEKKGVADVKSDGLGVRVGSSDARNAVTVAGEPANARTQPVSGAEGNWGRSRLPVKIAWIVGAAVAVGVLG